MASVGILLFLLLVLLEVLSAAWNRFRSGGQPDNQLADVIVMGATFACQPAVVFYERRAAARLKSDVLLPTRIIRSAIY